MNTFTANTRIESTKVNENFAELVAERNGWTSISSATYNAANSIVSAPYAAVASKGDKFRVTQSIPLTAYFPLEDKDSDVGSFTVSNIGTPTYTAGKFTNALTLNGTDQALSINDVATLKPTGAFTIGCWVKSSGTGDMAIFQSKSKNTNYGGIFLIMSSKKIRFQTGSNTSTSYSDIAGSADYNDNAWHYVVCSYQNNFGKLFVDGVLVASGYMMAPAYASTNYIRVGCMNETGSNNNWFNGQIDDMFFINGYAVDLEWVQTQYALGTAQGTANITPNQYFNIIDVNKATNVITLIGGADYVLYNGTITNPNYSKSNAVGFPVINFASTVNGLSAIGNAGLKFQIDGHLMTIWPSISGKLGGTSNATTFSFTIPIAAVSSFFQTAFVQDNGTDIDGGQITVSAGSATVNVYKSWFNGAFTNSGAKGVYFNRLTIEI